MRESIRLRLHYSVPAGHIVHEMLKTMRAESEHGGGPIDSHFNKEADIFRDLCEQTEEVDLIFLLEPSMSEIEVATNYLGTQFRIKPETRQVHIVENANERLSDFCNDYN